MEKNLLNMFTILSTLTMAKDTYHKITRYSQTLLVHNILCVSYRIFIVLMAGKLVQWVGNLTCI